MQDLSIQTARLLRAAFYGRYSSEMQRDSSIDDQFRQAQWAAEKKNWQILSEYCRSDKELSGATLLERESLQSLIADAKSMPRPYDVLMIDDTSRLGRNLTLVLTLMEVLRHTGIFLYFVSQQLDSRQPNFRQLFIMNGMMDEGFLENLKAKVHRGQEGRFLAGMVPGGKCFGYRNVPIEHPFQKGEYGRPKIIGVRADINPSQAAVVIRIYRMYSEEHLSLVAIAKRLNNDGSPRPEPRVGIPDPTWSPGSVRCILQNERYRGRVKWNLTVRVREPETFRVVAHDRPEEEWQVREDESLRIVSDKLWQAVQERINYVNVKFGVPTKNGGEEGKVIGASILGGLNRTSNSANYLFSGSMICGYPECGGPIISTGGSGTNLRYGCRNHRFKGTCDNSLTVLRSELENQLMAALISQFLQPELIDLAIEEFDKELKKENSRKNLDRQNAAGSKRQMQKELRVVEVNIQNIIKAIGSFGPDFSSTFEAELRQLQSRKNTLAAQLGSSVEPLTLVLPNDLRQYVLAKTADLQTLLLGDRPAAKQAIQQYIGKLTLTPVRGPDGRKTYSVNGAISPFSGPCNVMPLVAPQGTTGYENKGDMVFSTVFPKPFPTREIRMCIPICCTLRRTSQDRFSSPIREGNFTCLRRFGRGIEPRLAPDRNQRPRRGPTVWLLMEVGAMSDTTA